MSFRAFIAGAALVAAGALAHAEAPTATERARTAVATEIERGVRRLERAGESLGNAARLASLDDAIRILRAARIEAGSRFGEKFAALRRRAEAGLVSALGAEAAIHLDRGSLPLARKRVTEALDVAPRDERARELAARIRDAESADATDRPRRVVSVQRGRSAARRR